jgi:two-component system, cell cycle sensor histidine kinase and response regulator CckA
VYSERGKGSTLKIFLPAATAVAEPATPPVDIQALRGTETVLVVEDQMDVRGVIERTLSRYGYTVVAAANGPEALATAQKYQGTIHVMLTDVVLPGASGREVARQVVATRPSLRVLYMSGYTDEVIVQHGVLEPGLASVQKPFTGESLARRIRAVLAADTPRSCNKRGRDICLHFVTRAGRPGRATGHKSRRINEIVAFMLWNRTCDFVGVTAAR